MEWLRAWVKWISTHRLISGVIAALFVAGMLFTNFYMDRSEGVLSEPIHRGAIVQSVYGIGTVTANRIFQIKLAVIGTINEIYVKEGSAVKKGDRLVTIDHVVYRAPFDGTVTSLPFNVGENVFPQLVILSLVDLSDRYLVVSLEQQGALRIERGQKVIMSFDTIREQNYDGVVQSVYSNENNFLARIDISSLPPRILPGMTGDVAIATLEHQNVLLIPTAALEKGDTVWVKRGIGIPRKATVKIGIVDKAMAEVLSGDLEEGDRVLIRTRQNGQ